MMNNRSNRYSSLTELLNENYKTRVGICQKLASHVENKHKRGNSNQYNRTGLEKGINQDSIAEIESLAGLSPEQIMQRLVDNMK